MVFHNPHYFLYYYRQIYTNKKPSNQVQTPDLKANK